MTERDAIHALALLVSDIALAAWPDLGLTESRRIAAGASHIAARMADPSLPAGLRAPVEKGGEE